VYSFGGGIMDHYEGYYKWWRENIRNSKWGVGETIMLIVIIITVVLAIIGAFLN
jgi:hypothetical protein